MIIHVPGRKNAGADAASRYPSPSLLATIPDPLPSDIAEDSATVASMSNTLYSVTNVTTWSMVREATASDETLRELASYIQEGFPDSRELSPSLRPYQRLLGSLSVVDGVILAGSRIIMPASLRPNILSALHAAHQGVSGMAARAADSVYWPNMTTDIHRVRDECSHCHRIAKSNPMQPPSEIIAPDYPFQKLCCDYFTYGNHDYLVIVNR